MHIAVQLLIAIIISEFIAVIPQDVVQSLIESVYNFTLNRSLLNKQGKLKQDIMNTKKQLNSTSSQDEFSKWAKLKRNHDKLLKQHEDTKQENSKAQMIIKPLVKVVMFALPSVLQFGVTIANGKRSIIHLPPHNWFGSALTLLFSLPFSPRGTISASIYGMVVKRVVKLFRQFIQDLGTIIFGVKNSQASAARRDDSKQDKQENSSVHTAQPVKTQ